MRVNEFVVVPVSVICGLCQRPYEISLRLPADVDVSKPPSFTCRTCSGTARVGAPLGTDRREWIRTCAAAGWKCVVCNREVDFESVTNIDGRPACDRCRWRAYRADRIERDAA